MEDPSNSPSEIVHKKQNKDRVKEHRERKKRYIENLESQIVQLKAQIVSLKAENKKLAEETKYAGSVSITKGIEGLLQQLEDDSKYSLETLPEMLKNNPEQVKFSMIEQASDTLYNCRIQLIKKWFRTVLENIVDDKIKINS